MSAIIAGRFDQQEQVEKAISALTDAGFPSDRISSFYLNPAGQHDIYPIGGDRDESPGARHADGGSAKGMVAGGVAGAIAGAVAIPVVGPLAVPVAAGVGAYTGSLVGALSGTSDGPKREQEYLRTAGTMIAVNASLSDVATETIARIMKENNAVEVEDAEGTWAAGTWSDFDPLSIPHRMDEPPPVPSPRASPPPAS